MYRLLLFLLLTVTAFAQKELNERIAKADREAARGNLPKAEKMYREILAAHPDSLKAHRLLADVLFFQRKLTHAAEEYARTRDLDNQQKQLTPEQRRHVLNQLGVSYAMNGDYKRAEQSFKEAIAEEPDYAIYHYNLACTYAESDRLEPAIAALQHAWSLRDKLPDDERFPDPRKDSSFGRYLKNKRFLDAINEMVF